MLLQYTVNSGGTFPNRKVDLARFEQEIRASAITVALAKAPYMIEGINCGAEFRADLSTEEILIFESLVSVHSGEPLPAGATVVTVSNPYLSVNALPPSGLKSNQISQNWCDRTTWWYSAEFVTDEAATTSDAERKIWLVANQHVIDVYHGKLTGEEAIPQYRVRVTLAGAPLVERDPHFGVGGDFVVDYASGSLIFAVAVPEGVTPVVDYAYEHGSTWVMQPTPGEVWKLKGAESQFSEDVVMTDSMVYEVWVYNPADLPSKMMVAAPDYYKTIQDFVNDSNKSYAPIPAIGGAGWRGASKQSYVFAWDFQTTTELSSKYGMELRVRLEHDLPYGGTCATGSFYFIREDEG